jgi:hypothetical protein
MKKWGNERNNFKIIMNYPGTIAHACNPSWDKEDRGSMPARSKSAWHPYLNLWLGALVCSCHPQLHGESEIGDL